MPITFSFDIEQSSIKDANDRTRIQLAFLRFGWEHLGGSSWRYPSMGTPAAPEDWFNHVVPALMYFRALVEHASLNVTRFALDAHSESGFRLAPTALGAPILKSDKIALSPPGVASEQEVKLSEARLKAFLKDSADSLA